MCIRDRGIPFKIFCNGIPHTGSKIHLRGMNHDIGVNKAVDSRTFEEVKTVKPPVFSVHDGECRHGGTVGRYRRKSKDRYPQLICGSLCRIHRLAAAHSKYHINRFIFIAVSYTHLILSLRWRYRTFFDFTFIPAPAASSDGKLPSLNQYRASVFLSPRPCVPS